MKTTALVLEKYDANLPQALLGLQVREVQLPDLKPFELLVEVEATTCNPSDLSFLSGQYGIKRSLPTVPGFEACGKIVGVGSAALENRLGERIAFVAQPHLAGTWAKHCVANAAFSYRLADSTQAEQAAGMIVNPLTAIALARIAKASPGGAAIVTAAASQLAGMLRGLAQEMEFTIINIVRKDEQVNSLKASGQAHVLNASEPTFFAQLKALAHQLDARLALDAVGAEMPGTLFAAMPNNARVISYGAISGKPIGGIHPLDIIYNGKTLGGFILTESLVSAGPSQFQHDMAKVESYLSEGRFRTQVARLASLDDAPQAFLAYAANLSQGKTILRPNG